MSDVVLLVVAAVWLAMLGLGALVVRRELELLTDRVAAFGQAPMDGMAIGAFAPRLPGLRRSDVVLFLFGDCDSCYEVVDAIHRSPGPDRFLCVVNDGTIPGSAEGVLAALPAATRRLAGAGARSALERFQVHSAPFAIAVADGLVAAKATLRDRRELDRLVRLVRLADGRRAQPDGLTQPSGRDHEAVA